MAAPVLRSCTPAAALETVGRGTAPPTARGPADQVARRSTRRLAFGAALVAALPVLPAAPADAAFPGRNGRIAYVDDTAAGQDVFTVRADGRSRVRLTRSGDAGQPAWSRDGRRLAFVRRAGLSGDVWVMRADGTGGTRLTSGPADDSGPAWSPDGRRLVFTRDGRLHVYTLSTRRLSRISGSRTHDPSWSPDGRLIAFAREVGTGRLAQSDLFTVRPDGTGLRRVGASTAVAENAPDWSPDGRRLAYTRGGSACTLGVWSVRLDGSGRQQVREDACNDLDPAWSPDGRRVAVESSTGPGRQEGLWTVGPTGRSPRFLVAGGREPSWQPVP